MRVLICTYIHTSVCILCACISSSNHSFTYTHSHTCAVHILYIDFSPLTRTPLSLLPLPTHQATVNISSTPCATSTGRCKINVGQPLTLKGSLFAHSSASLWVTTWSTWEGDVNISRRDLVLITFLSLSLSLSFSLSPSPSLSLSFR